MKDKLQEAAVFFAKAFQELTGASSEPEKILEEATIPLAKSLDIEKQQFMAVVLRPNKLDTDNNFYSAITVEKACHDFNEHCRTSNLQHLFDTKLVNISESYIAPADFLVEDQQFLKGDWVAVSEIRDADLWQMCKDGGFTGYSVGCMGKALIEKTDD